MVIPMGVELRTESDQVMVLLGGLVWTSTGHVGALLWVRVGRWATTMLRSGIYRRGALASRRTPVVLVPASGHVSRYLANIPASRERDKYIRLGHCEERQS